MRVGRMAVMIAVAAIFFSSIVMAEPASRKVDVRCQGYGKLFKCNVYGVDDLWPHWQLGNFYESWGVDPEQPEIEHPDFTFHDVRGVRLRNWTTLTMRVSDGEMVWKVQLQVKITKGRSHFEPVVIESGRKK
jgi:hypothetical protein